MTTIPVAVVDEEAAEEGESRLDIIRSKQVTTVTFETLLCPPQFEQLVIITIRDVPEALFLLFRGHDHILGRESQLRKDDAQATSREDGN